MLNMEFLISAAPMINLQLIQALEQNNKTWAGMYIQLGKRFSSTYIWHENILMMILYKGYHCLCHSLKDK